MSKIDGTFIINSFENTFGLKFNEKKTLFIVLGLLGDFDSFEYVQSLIKFLPRIKNSDIDLCIVGIGDLDSKKRFCKYTNLPENYIYIVENSDFHKALLIEPGLSITPNPLLNLTLMCMGVGSPGTLSEVLRGYLGDKSSMNLFSNGEMISLFRYGNFNASLFNILGKEKVLRPFELATLRLMNMIEVLSNWRTYMINDKFLTQRSATFIVDSNYRLIYSFYSKGLLGFSESMSKPLEFLENWI